MEIEFNKESFNLKNPNAKLKIIKNKNEYKINEISDKKPLIVLTYDKIKIISNNIHHIYVVLQYIKNVTSIKNLSKLEWNLLKFKINITSKKELPDWARILNCLLNLKKITI